MKAGIFFTGNGPILILTRFDSFTEPSLLHHLRSKGFNKFIAYEVPVDAVKNRYGNHYDVVMEDLKQDDNLRVVDEDGHHILENFSLKEFSAPIIWEEGVVV